MYAVFFKRISLISNKLISIKFKNYKFHEMLFS